MDKTEISVIMMEIDQLETDLLRLKDDSGADLGDLLEKVETLKELRDRLATMLPNEKDNIVYANFSTKEVMGDAEATDAFKEAIREKASVDMSIGRLASFIHPDKDERAKMHKQIITHHFSDLLGISKHAAFDVLNGMAKEYNARIKE